MALYITDIETVVEKQNVGENLLKILNIFLNSITDWPKDVFTLEEYVEQLEEFVKGEVTKHRLANILKEINIMNNAWYVESITQISEAFNYYPKDITLKQIINDLRIKLDNEA